LNKLSKLSLIHLLSLNMRLLSLIAAVVSLPVQPPEVLKPQSNGEFVQGAVAGGLVGLAALSAATPNTAARYLGMFVGSLGGAAFNGRHTTLEEKMRYWLVPTVSIPAAKALNSNGDSSPVPSVTGTVKTADTPQQNVAGTIKATETPQNSMVATPATTKQQVEITGSTVKAAIVNTPAVITANSVTSAPSSVSNLAGNIKIAPAPLLARVKTPVTKIVAPASTPATAVTQVSTTENKIVSHASDSVGVVVPLPANSNTKAIPVTKANSSTTEIREAPVKSQGKTVKIQSITSPTTSNSTVAA
jgi:hypothetical protein